MPARRTETAEPFAIRSCEMLRDFGRASPLVATPANIPPVSAIRGMFKNRADSPTEISYRCTRRRTAIQLAEPSSLKVDLKLRMED